MRLNSKGEGMEGNRDELTLTMDVITANPIPAPLQSFAGGMNEMRAMMATSGVQAVHG